MHIISATWYDDFNQPFLVEYFDTQLDEEKIFDFYEQEKSYYGRSLIASYPDTRVFSDGTRVILRLGEVKQTIERTTKSIEEGYIDVESGIVGQGISRLTG